MADRPHVALAVKQVYCRRRHYALDRYLLPREHTSDHPCIVDNAHWNAATIGIADVRFFLTSLRDASFGVDPGYFRS